MRCGRENIRALRRTLSGEIALVRRVFARKSQQYPATAIRRRKTPARAFAQIPENRRGGANIVNHLFPRRTSSATSIVKESLSVRTSANAAKKDSSCGAGASVINDNLSAGAGNASAVGNDASGGAGNAGAVLNDFSGAAGNATIILDDLPGVTGNATRINSLNPLSFGTGNANAVLERISGNAARAAGSVGKGSLSGGTSNTNAVLDAMVGGTATASSIVKDSLSGGAGNASAVLNDLSGGTSRASAVLDGLPGRAGANISRQGCSGRTGAVRPSANIAARAAASAFCRRYCVNGRRNCAGDCPAFGAVCHIYEIVDAVPRLLNWKLRRVAKYIRAQFANCRRWRDPTSRTLSSRLLRVVC